MSSLLYKAVATFSRKIIFVLSSGRNILYWRGVKPHVRWKEQVVLMNQRVKCLFNAYIFLLNGKIISVGCLSQNMGHLIVIPSGGKGFEFWKNVNGPCYHIYNSFYLHQSDIKSCLLAVLTSNVTTVKNKQTNPLVKHTMNDYTQRGHSYFRTFSGEHPVLKNAAVWIMRRMFF
jgi:hypothetical protein